MIKEKALYIATWILTIADVFFAVTSAVYGNWGWAIALPLLIVVLWLSWVALKESEKLDEEVEKNREIREEIQDEIEEQ